MVEFEFEFESSGSRLSCWCVNLCQADLRKPSFLWSEALFDGDDDDEGGCFVDFSLFLGERC